MNAFRTALYENTDAKALGELLEKCDRPVHMGQLASYLVDSQRSDVVEILIENYDLPAEGVLKCALERNSKALTRDMTEAILKAHKNKTGAARMRNLDEMLVYPIRGGNEEVFDVLLR